MITSLALVLALAASALANDNGVGVTPQMGWRSWNAYHAGVSEELMMKVVDAMVDRSRKVDGKPTAIGDLYPIIGLDDNWQDCGAGPNNTFHAADGTPLFNLKLFPNKMKAWVDYAHSKGMKAGWYGNNCICHEHIPDMGAQATRDVKGEVAYIKEVGFDGTKLDGCGPEHDISGWADMLNATGLRVHIENCHNGNVALGNIPAWWPIDKPVNRTYCPYNQARSSTDIQSNWNSIFHNLQSTIPYQNLTNPQSRPGCWAYPDMLEVANHISVTESRSHFGAWCVVSSPLTLGYDVTNSTLTDSVWDIISNPEAIAVNQQWSGHPGRLVTQSSSGATGTSISWQVWAKPQPNKAVAVLFLSNEDTNPVDIEVQLSDLGISGTATVRDIWKRAAAGTASGALKVSNLAAHDSQFFLLTPQ